MSKHTLYLTCAPSLSGDVVIDISPQTITCGDSIVFDCSPGFVDESQIHAIKVYIDYGDGNNHLQDYKTVYKETQHQTYIYASTQNFGSPLSAFEHEYTSVVSINASVTIWFANLHKVVFNIPINVIQQLAINMSVKSVYLPGTKDKIYVEFKNGAGQVFVNELAVPN